jgi:hypothetical protein
MSEAQDEKPFVFMYLEPDESRNFSYDEDENGNLIDPRTRQFEEEVRRLMEKG